jgi:hypothetical protein
MTSVAQVEPNPLVLRPYVGLLYKPWMIGDDECGAIREMNEWQGKLKYSEETYPSAALATTDPTLDLPQSRTRAASVGSRRLTT